MPDNMLPDWVNQMFAFAAQDIGATARAHAMPSAVYRPTLSIDGNMYCALYGENLQEGVAGFGASPAEAMRDFDRAFCTVEGA